MKKIFTLLLLILTTCCNYIYAQVPNGNFENWISIPYSDPTGWQTGNQQDIPQLGVIPITQVNGISGFAVRMETYIVSGNSSSSYITNGDPFQGNGGVPCNIQPTSITGFYRNNTMVGDSAILIAVFKKNGSIFSTNIFYFIGNHSSFTSFSFPLSLGIITPDTVILAAASSNLVSGMGVQAGSFLELDGLGLGGTTFVIPNGGFDNWTNITYDLAQGWETSGDATKTTDSYTGFAIKLMTTNSTGGGGISQAGMTCGHQTNSGPSGGIPYTQMTDTLTGYYKYLAVNDSGNIFISVSKNGVGVGGNFKNITPTSNNYTYFEIPFQSGLAPDTLRIDANSSNWPLSSSSVGSALYIDNLSLKSTATGIFSFTNKLSKESTIFPNPVSNESTLRLNKNLIGNVVVEIVDATGRLIYTEQFTNSGTQLPLRTSALEPGLYYSRLTCGDFRVQNKFVKK